MHTSELNTNHESRGPAAAAPQLPTERDLDFTRLDRTVDRYQLLLLAKRVGKEAGFTPRMLQLLEYYLAFTTAVDWEEGSRPIVFQSLARTAMDLGVGERQIQKLEKRLFDIGAIAWNDSGNHKRFGRRDPKTGRLLFAYGVDLTPLAYLKEELEAKLHEKQLYAEAWRATKREISQHRRQVRELLNTLREEGADGDQLDSFETAYRKIAIELRSHIDLSRLRSLLKDHQSLLQALQKALTASKAKESQPPTTSLPIAPPTRRRSCSHAQKFAHQEHTIPKLNKGRAEDVSIALSARDVKAIGKVTPHQAAMQATDAFRAHLPLRDNSFKWNDLIEAAYHRGRELRVSQRDWSEACLSAGRRGAAIRIILTDRAASRSSNPVRFPAAYFRKLTSVPTHAILAGSA